ncbi:MAG TPA: class I SAM-dependent methyltransferase [Candidatus Lokiarchaeia archaeon]|nr:class I SAM-dependent methyltransferase [Candidatus Lokiarchaeia archaeon]
MSNILNKLRSWAELIKIGNVGKYNQDVKKFYHGNILHTLQDEGWLEYLKAPHTIEEIAAQFQYTDLELLKLLLKALVDDKSLIVRSDATYIASSTIDLSTTVPKPFNESHVLVQQNLASALPDRLRGNYHEFTGGIDLYNWDDALTANLYTHLQKGACAFAGAAKKRGKFLDVGCGNGFETAGIWTMYYQNHCFFPGTPMKMMGIDADQSLLNIARDEFPRWVTKHWGKQVEPIDIHSMEPYFPEFQVGKAEELPFEDNSFDIVYTSNTLLWTNAPLAIKEMIRITKPGGMVFGSVRLFPHADWFAYFHTQVIKGASGFFTKKDFIQWAKEAGAKKVEFATIVSFFKIIK